MTSADDIYKKVGEALELSQMLEEAVTIPIMMLFMIESGWQKDLSFKDTVKLAEASGVDVAKHIKSKPFDKKMRQNLRLQVGQITLLVQNGTMGELKKALESRLHISPGGPSVFLDILQESLESRNYLCHNFFKDYMASSINEKREPDAIAKLEEIQNKLRDAISFADSLTSSLQQQFPKTFTDHDFIVH